jgi:hypothetical protein
VQALCWNGIKVPFGIWRCSEPVEVNLTIWNLAMHRTCRSEFDYLEFDYLEFGDAVSLSK